MSKKTEATVTDTTATEIEEFLPMVDVDHDPSHFAPEAEETEAEELTVESVVRDLVLTIPTKEITAYAIHTVINKALEVFNSNIQIRPQMMYNYARNGMIVKGHKGTRTYTQDEVIAFATKFVEKRVTK